MFQRVQHREEDPQAGQQRGLGKRLAVPHLAAAEPNQQLLHFLGRRSMTGSHLPDQYASHAGHEQSPSDRRGSGLSPLFKIHARALEQLEKALDVPLANV